MIKLGVGGTLTADQIGTVLICLRRSIDKMELEFAALAATFAESKEWERQGSVSPVHWLRHECKTPTQVAADRICVGQQLTNLAKSVEAVAEGRIGFAHLALIAQTQEAVAENGRSLDESRLLAQAEELSVSEFRRACRHARHAADPEGVAREEAEAVDARCLELNQVADGVFIQGFVESAGAAVLRSALEPLARRTGRGDDRRRDRRLMDALVELSNRALDTGSLPQHGSQRPHLQVTSSLETLLGRVGSPAAELEFSLPISSRTVERFACDCNLTRVLLNSDSMVIDIGRSKRVITGSRRRALVARDKHCRWPGCDRPASWSTAHHLVHWIHGGSSDLDNQVLLCYRHHWLVHEGRWQLIKQEDGSLRSIPPPYAIQPWARGPDQVIS
jgi:hypothetical protein